VMADPQTRKDELTTDELSSYGISPKQPDEPKPVKGQEPETERKHDDQRAEMRAPAVPVRSAI
jgi:hypothetical protein